MEVKTIITLIVMVSLIIGVITWLTLAVRKDRIQEEKFEEEHEPQTYSIVEKWFIVKPITLDSPPNGPEGVGLKIYNNLTNKFDFHLPVEAGYLTNNDAIEGMQRITGNAKQNGMTGGYTLLSFMVIVADERKLKQKTT